MLRRFSPSSNACMDAVSMKEPGSGWPSADAVPIAITEPSWLRESPARARLSPLPCQYGNTNPKRDRMSDATKLSVILLAEDDSDDRLLLQDAISECKWSGEVRCVENGEELLDYLGRRGKFQPPVNAPWPALILLDLNMPRKDGREALR